jgi:hypothetical protein
MKEARLKRVENEGSVANIDSLGEVETIINHNSSKIFVFYLHCLSPVLRRWVLLK